MASPPLNMVKLNFDGSVARSGQASAGFVIRDHSGNPVAAGSRCIGSSSIPVAEGTALKDGLLAALRHNLKSVSLEGDSSLIIKCVNLSVKSHDS
ncbi:putative ribonuclease H-like domain-containing protein [Rosa chinensis]|uniref:Putative ribonuclease H-like domain-containing protein n=1 Tax=Rosa chinensis TaxID=74649 RepID=A0A2P6RHD2_ROSCH|nr:putative ribonuclease H-like domain-containing protein [Rosa chinensis]